MFVVLFSNEPGALYASSFSYYGFAHYTCNPGVKLVQLKKVMNYQLIPHELTTEAQNKNAFSLNNFEIAYASLR